MSTSHGPAFVKAASPERTPVRAQGSVRWAAGLGGSGLFQVTPKPTVAVFAFGALRRQRLSLYLDAQASVPVTDRIDGVNYRSSTYGLLLAPCVHLGAAFVCELNSVGVFSATGVQTESQSGARWLLSLGGRVGVEVPLSPSLAVLARADLLATPWPVRLESSGHPLWRAPVLQGGLGIAAVFHFP